MTLDAAAVEDYTQGRLDRDDPLTATLLARSLAAARRWCGWHVTPAQAETVVLDGPGGLMLVLPTLYLSALTAVTEDGTALDVADLQWSRRGLVRKTSAAAWTTAFSGVEVEMTHGFPAAQDFEAAVLSMVDRSSLAAAGIPVSVGPFRWNPEGSEASVLEQYRLERAA